MSRLLVFALPFLVAGCQDGSPRCAFLSGADEVETLLVALGYGEFAGEDPFSEGPGEVLQTEASWDSAVQRWGTDGGLTPDFATELVFVYRWSDGGCDEPVQYGAWHADDSLRLVAVEDDGGCDASFPQIDLILVEHGDATDIAWCAAN